jgi:hypothetical protein
MTVGPVVVFSPVAGDHVYEFAPEAVIVVVVMPEQIVVLVAVVVITGVEPAAVTFTSAVVDVVQVVAGSVPVTVYVVVVVGEAITVAPLGVFNEPVGAQVYVSASGDEAVSVVEAPEQIVVTAGLIEIGVVVVTKFAARKPFPPPVFCTLISTVEVGPRNPVNALGGLELQQPAVYAVEPFTINVTTSSCWGKSIR